VILLGLLSGTSLDGVDAALVEAGDPAGAGAGGPAHWRLLAFRTFPFETVRRSEIHEAIHAGDAAALTRLHGRLGEWFAEAALQLLHEADFPATQVDAIGSHGQTVWHHPPGTAGPGRGFTLQLGDPATLAERTGIPVVSDFRSRDMAAGGEGAPLVPWADRALFSVPGRARILQNLGGMGNLTWLPPRGDPAPLLAFDTGPGVILLDAAARQATGGEWAWDVDGALADRGVVDVELLDALLADPFFRRPPPRSTGREYFGPSRVTELAAARGLVPGRPLEGWPDLLATLAALTAESIARSLRDWVAPRSVDELVLAGGGARNPALVRAIAEAVAPLPTRTGDAALGVDPDAREAVAFALLAWAFLHGIPANDPGVTGAAGVRVLGSLTPGSSLPQLPWPPSRRGVPRP